MRVVVLDLFRRAEQEARLGRFDHFEVVVAVAAGDGLKADGLKAAHGRKLGMLASHLDAADESVGVHLERVAENGRPAEFFHQRLCKFLKGVAQNDGLRLRSQLVEEFFRPRKRVDARDSLLNFLESQAVLAEHAQAPFHQLVVVRLVARGARQLGNAALAGKFDPNFGDEHALHIKAGNIHVYSPLSLFRRGLAEHVVEHLAAVDHVAVTHRAGA